MTKSSTCHSCHVVNRIPNEATRYRCSNCGREWRCDAHGYARRSFGSPMTSSVSAGVMRGILGAIVVVALLVALAVFVHDRSQANEQQKFQQINCQMDPSSC